VLDEIEMVTDRPTSGTPLSMTRATGLKLTPAPTVAGGSVVKDSNGAGADTTKEFDVATTKPFTVAAIVYIPGTVTFRALNVATPDAIVVCVVVPLRVAPTASATSASRRGAY